MRGRTGNPARSVLAVCASWHCLHKDSRSPLQNRSQFPLCGTTWCATLASRTWPWRRHSSHSGCFTRCCFLRCFHTRVLYIHIHGCWRYLVIGSDPVSCEALRQSRSFLLLQLADASHNRRARVRLSAMQFPIRTQWRRACIAYSLADRAGGAATIRRCRRMTSPERHACLSPAAQHTGCARPTQTRR